MLDKIINTMLVLRWNETIELKNLCVFDEIIIQLINKQRNIRWCNNKKCVCHPEASLLNLIENDDIKDFLIKYNLYDEIKHVASEDYEPITVFDIGLVSKNI